MVERDRQPVFGRRFARNLWRLTRLYWTAKEGRRGAVLLATAVALELGLVAANVLIALAQKEIFDAVEQKQPEAFLAGTGMFALVVSGFVLVSAYRIYVRQWLEMNWRRSVTAWYVERWIGPQAWFHRELHAGEADNPDQRIAEDVRNYVASTLGLSLSLLAALATLFSFAGILWSESADWPLQWRGRPLEIPGLMLWVAVIYALVAMGLTHLVGRPLVPINFHRQRVEADFRYSLVRFRDNVESVALAGGAGYEQRSALTRFAAVMQNWWQLIAAQRRLTIFTTAVGQANGVVPVLIAAPAYFAGWMTLGSVAQMRTAYGQVSGSLAWFVYAYQEIAQWRASIERLSTFADVVEAADADMARTERLPVVRVPGDSVRLCDVQLTLPDGRVLLKPANGTIAPGASLAIIGSAGAGKTTLFRALAGLWPFGSGRIEVPRDARMMFLPQKPYLPIGTIRDIVSYPSANGGFEDEHVREALSLLGLDRLAGQLDTEASWDQHASTDEQQRLSIARVLLHRPDWVFLDDATAALDEGMERRVYDLLRERLPSTTIVSMTRRPVMAGVHASCWTMTCDDDGVARLDTGEGGA